MPSTINQLIVAELATRFRQMAHAVLVDFTGVSAQQANALRAKLGEQGAQMVVVKNSLAVLALRQLEMLDVAELVNGPTAFICGGDDPVDLAKMVFGWGKAEGVLQVRGGMVEGRAIDAEGMAAVAAVAPLQVLRAQLAGAIAAPLSGFVGALNGVLRNVVGVLNAIAEKHDSATSPPPEPVEGQGESEG